LQKLNKIQKYKTYSSDMKLIFQIKSETNSVSI